MRRYTAWLITGVCVLTGMGLRAAGANDVVAAEGEVALGMTERLLVHLGATNEQLDRARDRVRVELSGRMVTE